MAHNLNKHNGKYSFFSNKEVAWHGLGQIVDGAQTAEEAMKLANLDFTVTKVPLFTKSGIEAPKVAILRTDTNKILGVVGKDYEPLQNADAFSFFDELTLKEEAMYETAGVIGDGERIWILAKLPSYIRVGKDDIVEKYILIANSHDGSLAVTAKFTPIRVVCDNTLSMSLRTRDSKVSIRHTRNVKERLETAYKILGLYDKRSKEIEKIYNDIANKSATDKWVKDTLKILVPDNPNSKNSTRTKNIRDGIFKFYQNGIGQEDIVGTKWGFYNGFTGFLDHDKYNSIQKSFEYNMFGLGEAKKVEALTLCLS